MPINALAMDAQPMLGDIPKRKHPATATIDQ
jgi:hypothetical protein